MGIQPSQKSILLVLEDISEHRRVQKLLHERKQWLEDVIDNAPVLIWVATPAGKIDFFNKAWQDFTGKLALDNDFPTGSIHPDDRVRYLAQFANALRNRTAFTSEYRLLRHDGTYRWVLEHAKPMFSVDNKFNGFIGSGSDIDDKKSD